MKASLCSIKNHQSGQAIILVMGLVLIASVVVFMVFNSGRATNEKINLVNAADAAAYSGAQIAARQLNFMAYTNRAMIANEVAIGHMFSFQMEIDLLAKSAPVLIAKSLPWWLSWIPGLTSFLNSLVAPVVQPLAAASGVISGIYATSVDSSNAYFSGLQYEAFKDFALPDRGTTLIESAMKSVLNEYEIRPTARIELNDKDVLRTFVVSDQSDVAVAALDATNMGASLCNMIMFVRPGASGELEYGDSSSANAFCADLATGSASGSEEPPAESDSGTILSMLNYAVSNSQNADWINDRNATYRLWNSNIVRTGKTQVQIDPLSGKLNWRSLVDTIRIDGTVVSASGDITQMSRDAANLIDGAVSQTLLTQGLCGNDVNSAVQCSDVLTGQYGGIRRYAYLNPSATNPVITAFLSQPNCSDSIGVDDMGNKKEGWHDKARFLDEAYSAVTSPTCGDTVYAVAQAEVYFERPPCSDAVNCTTGFSALKRSVTSPTPTNELPNLFNPFWQVKIKPATGG